jgi:hypothetical protein
MVTRKAGIQVGYRAYNLSSCEITENSFTLPGYIAKDDEFGHIVLR